MRNINQLISDVLATNDEARCLAQSLRVSTTSYIEDFGCSVFSLATGEENNVFFSTYLALTKKKTMPAEAKVGLHTVHMYICQIWVSW